MKTGRFGRVRPVTDASAIFGSVNAGPDGQSLQSIGSNTVSWGSNVAIITSNGSNALTGPYVNFASGAGIAFAASSNTLTISATGGGGGAASISAGSNSTRVSEDSSAGASTTLWSPFDHRHDGIGTITSSSSNTMQRGTWNIRAGSGIALSLTDTDGDGEFDTTTIVNTGQGGGGGSPGASGALVFISETVLGSANAELNITGIPATYKDLIIVARFRSATASTKAIRMRLGDSSAIDAGTNYSFNRRYDGTLANGASQNASASYMECGALPGSGSTAGFFGAGRWELIDYASTSRSRIVIGETFDDGNDGNFMNSVGGMWKNVTAAVARIRLIVDDGSNFDTGSSIAVYGRG